MTVRYAKYDDGGLIQFVGEMPAVMLELQGENIFVGAADPRTDYIVDGQCCRYTEAEQQAKDTLPPGWIWKMPDRSAVDMRTPDQQEKDIAAAILAERAAAYPPLADLADALYWQVQGDDSKIAAYMASCAAVKVQFPKVTVK